MVPWRSSSKRRCAPGASGALGRTTRTLGERCSNSQLTPSRQRPSRKRTFGAAPGATAAFTKILIATSRHGCASTFVTTTVSRRPKPRS
jgi:hypothetical protein